MCHLQVVKQCVETEGVQPDYVRREILPEFFRSFWVRRMALDRRNYRALVETTVALANKVRGFDQQITIAAPNGPSTCACCAQLQHVFLLLVVWLMAAEHRPAGGIVPEDAWFW